MYHNHHYPRASMHYFFLGTVIYHPCIHADLAHDLNLAAVYRRQTFFENAQIGAKAWLVERSVKGCGVEEGDTIGNRRLKDSHRILVRASLVESAPSHASKPLLASHRCKWQVVPPETGAFLPCTRTCRRSCGFSRQMFFFRCDSRRVSRGYRNKSLLFGKEVQNRTNWQCLKHMS